jgi:poly-gamma-glutamate biosynthesis protein PgsC/CapC
MELLPESIGLGLAVILAFGELFGLAAGGMVVPGYLALQFDQPLRIVGTLVVAGLVFVLMRGANRVMLLYGRRRFVLTVMVGFLFGLIGDQIFDLRPTASGAARSIGFVLPGLIAHTMESQGVVVTLGALTTVTVLTRLILVAAFGAGVHF